MQDVQKGSDPYQFSKRVDENGQDFEGLPYPDAFDLLTDSGESPPAWLKIENGELEDDEAEKLVELTEKYHNENLRERFEDQYTKSLMLEEVDFWKPHWRFVKDLTNNVLNNGILLSEKQEAWLNTYLYKYREQVRDSVIYEETAPDELYERIDNTRDAVSEALESAEEDYQNNAN